MEWTIDGPEYKLAKSASQLQQSIHADEMQDQSSSKRPQISGELDLRTEM
jgi:hypothetical protein